MATKIDAGVTLTKTLDNLDILASFNNTGQYAAQLTDVADTKAAMKPLNLDTKITVDASGEQVIKSSVDPSLSPQRVDDIFDPSLPADQVGTRLRKCLTDEELTEITESFSSKPKNEGLVDTETARANTAQTESMRPKADEVYGENMSTPEGQAKFNEQVGSVSKKSYNGVVKYAALAGLTYAVCDGMAKKLNGCWLVDGQTGERIVKVSGDKSHCGCGGKDPVYQSDTIYRQHAQYCQAYCEQLDNAGQLTGDAWANCTDICYCVDKNGKMQQHQYKFEWVSTDAWGVFSSTLGDIGGQVVDITEDILEVIDSAVEGVGNFMEWLKKYWWTFLVAAGVAVLIWVCVKYIPSGKGKSSSSSSSTQSSSSTAAAAPAPAPAPAPPAGELGGGYSSHCGAYSLR
jgi:hypothetical protein